MKWRPRPFLILLFLLLTSCASSIRFQVDPDFNIKDDAFGRTMANLSGPPIIFGNRVTALRNGDEIFPAMLAAIERAYETITFETFIYWQGDIGQRFSDALCGRARAGVKVLVILDWLGTNAIDGKYIEEMKAAGVQLVRFHPIHWYNLTTAFSVNHRTHRKLLIVDGKVGFIGGVGIADEWMGNAANAKEFRDNHYKVEGPAVVQLQAAFMDNWIKTTGHVPLGDGYFPALVTTGDQAVQVFKSSPRDGTESLELLYLLSIAAAHDRIRLASAYFVPDDLTTKALVEARHRGVVVEIIVPGRHIDVEFVRSASRARWGPLLKAGVDIYEYKHTMFHVKQAIFDDRWVLLGSSNLDPRSFRLNDEVNLNVLDTTFAAKEIQSFEADKAHARQMTYKEWSQRSWWESLGAIFPSLFSEEL